MIHLPPPRQRLQGRVITIDSIGIVLASNGDNIMPSIDDGQTSGPRPTRGDLFPWAAIKRVGFVVTGAQYEQVWRMHRVKKSVFMDANDTRPSASDSEYRAWPRGQDCENLQQRIQAEIDAEPPAGHGNGVD